MLQTVVINYFGDVDLLSVVKCVSIIIDVYDFNRVLEVLLIIVSIDLAGV